MKAIDRDKILSDEFLRLHLELVDEKVARQEDRAMFKELMEFGAVMAQKLEENTHKSGWNDLNADECLQKLTEESRELRAAIREKRGRKEVEREAADLANICMFIAYNVRRNPEGFWEGTVAGKDSDTDADQENS